ncbi:MAG: SDR family NAD(P)-dependent oxidoreductase, partial [Patulibacter sp.]
MNVLVTGAASGIGRATCLRIARDAADRGERARITAADIRMTPELESLVSELEALGAEVLPLASDLGSVDAPAEAVRSAVERFGTLDGLVSCAGINRAASLMSCSVEDWDRIFAVNTRATWLLAKAAHSAL